MKIQTVFATLLLSAFAFWEISPALAGGDTFESGVLELVAQRRAPLALSSDGRWIMYVDAMNVLHRKNLRDAKQVQTLQLPIAARTLATSSNGRRLAFTNGSACIGIVDFAGDSASAVKLRWLPSGYPNPSASLDAEPMAPGMPIGRECGGQDDSVVALSSDGKLLATSSRVIDIATRQVLATLPYAFDHFNGHHMLKIEFADGDSKLVAIHATLDHVEEALGTPSHLEFASWNLSTKSLQSVSSLDDAPVIFSSIPLANNLSQTGVFYWVKLNEKPPNSGQTKNAEPIYTETVFQRSFHSCQVTAVASFPVISWDWQSLVVDPFGRWIAGVSRIQDTASENKEGHDIEELTIYDLSSHVEISRIRSSKHLRGLMSNANGTSIVGLSSPVPNPEIDPNEHSGGDLVKFDVNVGRIKTSKIRPNNADTEPCKVEDETDTARSLQVEKRRLKRLWAVHMKSTDEYRQEELVKLKLNNDGDSGQAKPLWQTHYFSSNSFVRHDGTFWIDKYSTIDMLNLQTGKVATSHRTPRSDKVLSVPVPAADGFINYQGNTVSWRPFNDDATKGSGKRVLEVRPGWTAIDVWVQNRSFSILWYPDVNAKAEKDPMVQRVPLKLATYDAADLRLVHVRDTDTEDLDIFSDKEAPGVAELYRKPCQDPLGPIGSGYDWRLSHFDSFRAYACGTSPAAMQTVFWAYVDIAPKSASAYLEGDSYNRRVWSLDGAIGVAQNGAVLHVFDIVAHREIGQIVTSNVYAAQSVHVIASEGLVLVELLEKKGEKDERSLEAYSFR